MHTRIANRAIVMILVISGAAIIIAMGMILTVIGASIYGMLAPRTESPTYIKLRSSGESFSYGLE